MVQCYKNVHINSDVLSRCHVELQMKNDFKGNHYNHIHHSELSIEAKLAAIPLLSYTESGSVWPAINPYFLPDKLKIIVKCTKNSYCYDKDTLRQTSN
ncbi:hypothetical protein Smp_020660 [Schistosoma mansoni]|uniref:hypothetical protein n=1 Tax=Schistosoma mansoni TaxID=6183 RepID=UPI0001A63440|nr:hypothetical protein Smp_020660 [Schistosoma mansoni]|eukprot:XP_018646233.1 hypothetical protein Smp_020660 [Schistosoma mansoni]